MSESAIELDWELEKDRKKDAKKRAHAIRKRLVMGDGSSRPSFMVAVSAHLLGTHAPSPYGPNGDHEKQNERAQVKVERFFRLMAWLAWLSVIGLVVFIGIFPGIKQLFFESRAAAIALALWSLFCLFTVMLDVATYQPRLFALCSGPPKTFFHSLSKLSTTLQMQLEQISSERPGTWRRAKELEQGLLAESSEFLVLGGVRTRVIFRVLHRLAAIVASLALLGYSLSAVTHGDLLATCGRQGEHGCVTSATSVPEHVYFALDAFFTGFSDISLVHDAFGYGYLTVIVLSFTAVVYFFLTEVVASQSEFRANMRSAAESYVLQQSRL
jgi:hypothetical protein